MRKFARLPASDRAAFFTEAAARRNLRPWLVEKDFWVCWLLREIYESPTLRTNLVFKGGTSLSKVFRIISRFSEDIDLSLSPGFLGFDEVALEEASSRTQRDRNQKRVEIQCEAAIRKQIAPTIQQAITSQLAAQSAPSWKIEATIDETTHSPVVLFHYPIAVAYDAYVRPEVKVEFGSLTDQQPTGCHKVRSILADEFPKELLEPDGAVVALEVERTFWEKATILHAEYHRPREQALRARFSRHYSDFAALVTHAVSAPTIKRTDLLARVARYKSRFFASGWAHYNEAVPGSFHVVPPEYRLREIENDYAKMADMFFETPPPFASVLNALENAERTINETR
jgi:hypothetical protein